jgi:GNAT superfamily N-acetyltransferase
MATVRPATEQDAPWMDAGFRGGMGWPKPDGYFVARVAEATAGEVVVLVAADDESNYLGHAIVQWVSRYAGFQEPCIPEVQDLNVIATSRRQGVGSMLLDHAERLIAGRSPHAGIGVGLYADYGQAQRLYVKRGYVPDGAGVMRNNQPVVPGSTERVDDELILYLIKPLRR